MWSIYHGGLYELHEPTNHFRESFDNSKPLIKRQSTHILPKEGKSPIEHINNYRPISLLNIPVKILEKILINRIIQHPEMNNLQNPRQHGFRKNRWTHTATAILSETIAIALGNGNKVNVVLKDLGKAFD